MNALISYFTKQHWFVNILTFFVLIVGVVSLMNLKRDAFPEVSFDMITITTPFPGASAESVESLITNPLESDLIEVEGVKEMNSVSIEGRSVIVLQLDPDQVTVEDAKSDALDVVDAFDDLPDGALDPVVIATDSSTRGLLEIALGSNLSKDELRGLAKKMKRYLEKVPGIATIRYRGLPEYEIRVEARVDEMRRRGVTFTDLMRTLRVANVEVPGGDVDLDGREFVVKTMAVAETPEQIENEIIRSNLSENHIRVRDVADVKVTFAEESVFYRTNQNRGINLIVSKKKSADTIRSVDALKAAVETFNKENGSHLEIQYVNDISRYVKRRVNVLSNNLIVGLVLVLIVLSIMLPFRMAMVAAMGIPFSFLVTMIIFQVGDISLNLISMMGLIIVLGMLVDDAVVVTENAQKKMDLGLPPEQAAIEGTQEIWRPVTTSIATTLAAFFPLMMMSGIFGKFMAALPIGVILALLVSLAECFFILPSHVASWVRPQEKRESPIWDRFFVAPYKRLLSLFIEYRYLALFLGILFTAFTGWFAATQMKFKLFPGAEDDNFKLSFETSLGTPLDVTEQAAIELENAVKGAIGEDIESIVTTVGLQPMQGPVQIGEKRGSNYGQIAFYVVDKKDRTRKIPEMMEAAKPSLEKVKSIKEFAFAQGRAGPPVGKAVNLRIIGDDYDVVRNVVGEVKELLKEIPGVQDINDTFSEGKEEILVRLKPDQISLAGVSRLDVANTVRAVFDGIVVDEIIRVDEKLEVIVTLPKSQKSDLESLKNIEISNPAGRVIKLSSLASIETRKSMGAIEHLDGLRTLQVQAEVDEKVTTSREANAELETRLQPIVEKYPDISFKFGGEEKDSQESLQTLKQTFALAFLGILLLLILQFKNLYHPMVVAGIIPLGFLSVIWTFYLHGMPISFLGMIGMVALAGVVVNNAIVLIDTVNREMESGGNDKKDVFIRAGVQRLRPIFLTTITTTAGILPTGYGLGGKDEFVVPIALALGWGIFFGAFLTTFVVPLLLTVMDEVRELFRRRPEIRS